MYDCLPRHTLFGFVLYVDMLVQMQNDCYACAQERALSVDNQSINQSIVFRVLPCGRNGRQYQR